MTISCGLCWNIDSRKIIWPPRAHFGSENESLKGLIVHFTPNKCYLLCYNLHGTLDFGTLASGEIAFIRAQRNLNLCAPGAPKGPKVGMSVR